MKISQYFEALPNLYKAGTTIHLVGAPGIGKTAVNRQGVEHMSELYGEQFGYAEVLCTAIDAPDVLGFLVPSKREDGQAVAHYTMSNVITKVEATGCERGILNLEEVGQADQLTQKALAQLMNERQVGDHKLPDGWFVVMSSNRVQDRAGAGRMLSHIINRIVTLEFTSDVESWSKWYEDEGKHPMGAAYAKARPGVLFTNEVPSKDGPYSTPRSFTRAIDYLSMIAGDDVNGNVNMKLPSDVICQEVVAGLMGEGSAADLFSFLKVESILPDITAILKDPKKAKLPPEDRLDGQYAVMQLLLHYAEPDNIEKLFDYGKRLNLELQTSLVRSLIKKSGGTLLNSPAISKFIADHRALIVGSLE